MAKLGELSVSVKMCTSPTTQSQSETAYIKEKDTLSFIIKKNEYLFFTSENPTRFKY